MSYFSEQLQDALRAADMTQAELSEAMHVSQSSINRYLKGEITPPVETFGALLDALPQSVHFDLILARLTDELPKQYRDSVNILANGHHAAREEAAPYIPPKVAKDLRLAIEYLISEAVQERTVRDLMIALARGLGARFNNRD